MASDSAPSLDYRDSRSVEQMSGGVSYSTPAVSEQVSEAPKPKSSLGGWSGGGGSGKVVDSSGVVREPAPYKEFGGHKEAHAKTVERSAGQVVRAARTRYGLSSELAYKEQVYKNFEDVPVNLRGGFKEGQSQYSVWSPTGLAVESDAAAAASRRAATGAFVGRVNESKRPVFRGGGVSESSSVLGSVDVGGRRVLTPIRGEGGVVMGGHDVVAQQSFVGAGEYGRRAAWYGSPESRVRVGGSSLTGGQGLVTGVGSEFDAAGRESFLGKVRRLELEYGKDGRRPYTNSFVSTAGLYLNIASDIFAPKLADKLYRVEDEWDKPLTGASSSLDILKRNYGADVVGAAGDAAAYWGSQEGRKAVTGSVAVGVVAASVPAFVGVLGGEKGLLIGEGLVVGAGVYYGSDYFLDVKSHVVGAETRREKRAIFVREAMNLAGFGGGAKVGGRIGKGVLRWAWEQRPIGLVSDLRFTDTAMGDSKLRLITAEGSVKVRTASVTDKIMGRSHLTTYDVSVSPENPASFGGVLRPSSFGRQRGFELINYELTPTRVSTVTKKLSARIRDARGRAAYNVESTVLSPEAFVKQAAREGKISYMPEQGQFNLGLSRGEAAGGYSILGNFNAWEGVGVGRIKIAKVSKFKADYGENWGVTYGETIGHELAHLKVDRGSRLTGWLTDKLYGKDTAVGRLWTRGEEAFADWWGAKAVREGVRYKWYSELPESAKYVVSTFKRPRGFKSLSGEPVRAVAVSVTTFGEKGLFGKDVRYFVEGGGKFGTQYAGKQRGRVRGDRSISLLKVRRVESVGRVTSLLQGYGYLDGVKGVDMWSVQRGEVGRRFGSPEGSWSAVESRQTSRRLAGKQPEDFVVWERGQSELPRGKPRGGGGATKVGGGKRKLLQLSPTGEIPLADLNVLARDAAGRTIVTGAGKYRNVALRYPELANVTRLKSEARSGLVGVSGGVGVSRSSLRGLSRLSLDSVGRSVPMTFTDAESVSRQVQGQRQGQSQLLRTVSGGKASISPIPPPPPPSPIPPPPPVGLWLPESREMSFGSGGRRVVSAWSPKYLPSVEAVALNIRGAKGLVAAKSGLGLRPITR